MPDYDSLSNVGKGRQITTQPQTTEPQSRSDKLFDDGVQAFGNKDYKTAISNFNAAIQLEPTDNVLPFAYAQALFANGQYDQSATVVEKALTAQSQKPEVFYPRGLYKDENVLGAQIGDLQKAVSNNPQNAHLRLLYGYQLMGMGDTDNATTELNAAATNPQTAVPAKALLELIARANQQSQNQQQNQNQNPSENQQPTQK